nr:hypothetical protein [Tanacetum cinerariifolium]
MARRIERFFLRGVTRCVYVARSDSVFMPGSRELRLLSHDEVDPERFSSEKARASSE